MSRLVGNLVNGFQKDVKDLFGPEGGEVGTEGLRGDVLTLPDMYPPPKATRRVPMRIDFFNNSKNVNVGHFNNISMPSHDGSGVPLLVQYKKSKMTDSHGGKSGMTMPSGKMLMTTFDSNEVRTEHTYLLFEIYLIISDAQLLYNDNNSTIIIIINIKVIELVLDNWDEGEHPIHIHGRRFYVMARGAENSGPFSNSTQILNEVDPILRDTVTVSALSYIGKFDGENKK